MFEYANYVVNQILRPGPLAARRLTETGMATARKPQAKGVASETDKASDPLMVASVEKAFRVLSVFDRHHQALGLSQIATAAGLDVSSAQRFTHTLMKLGYLHKNPDTKRFELTVKSLDLGHHFLRASRLVDKAMPYLLHLSKETEETVNLTMLDGTEIVFVTRFVSRHMLNTDVTIGTRMPAFCTAPGVAILSRLPEAEAAAILDKSELKAYAPGTTWKKPELMRKFKQSALQGYATAFEEFYHSDASIAAPILDPKGYPEGAVNIATSRSRYEPDEVVTKFSSLVMATAHAISRT